MSDMSKVKLLLDVVEDMQHLAASIKAMADSIEGSTPAGDPAPAAAPEKPTPTPTPVVTIEQVRAVLAEKSGDGKTQAVKALLYKYDAGKLSGVKPEDYPALLEEAKKL